MYTIDIPDVGLPPTGLWWEDAALAKICNRLIDPQDRIVTGTWMNNTSVAGVKSNCSKDRMTTTRLRLSDGHSLLALVMGSSWKEALGAGRDGLDGLLGVVLIALEVGVPASSATVVSISSVCNTEQLVGQGKAMIEI